MRDAGRPAHASHAPEHHADDTYKDISAHYLGQHGDHGGLPDSKGTRHLSSGPFLMQEQGEDSRPKESASRPAQGEDGDQKAAVNRQSVQSIPWLFSPWPKGNGQASLVKTRYISIRAPSSSRDLNRRMFSSGRQSPFPDRSG